MTAAYRSVHALGLGVSIDRPFEISYGLAGPPVVVRFAPAAGRRVRRGTSVTLTLACGCVVFTPGVPGKLPRYRLPNFIAQPAGVVFAWLSGRLIAARLHFGRLSGGFEPSLYANYTVSRQRPAAGTIVSFGRREGAPGSGTFVPTPIRIWLGQPTATGAITYLGGNCGLDRPALRSLAWQFRPQPLTPPPRARRSASCFAPGAGGAA